MSNTKHFYSDITVRIHQNSELYKRSFYVFNSCRSIINARTVVLPGSSLSFVLYRSFNQMKYPPSVMGWN